LKATNVQQLDASALLEGLDAVEEVLNEYLYIHNDVFTDGAVEQAETFANQDDGTATLENMLVHIMASLPAIADQLNKSNPVVSFIRANIRIDRSLGALVTNVFTHILRNCLDHGLEIPEERIAAGKKVTGRITVEPKLRSDKLEIHIQDDGRGL